MSWWRYENLPSGAPYDWEPAAKDEHPDDQLDFHVDLGCGRLKKGRLGIDRANDPDVDLVIDLEMLHLSDYGPRAWDLAREFDAKHGAATEGDHVGEQGNPARGLIPMQGLLPFPEDSIESIISHHCLEHIGPGFIRLMDECHRVLKPEGVFRIIVPLFPSRSAVEDPDHKRYFMEGTFDAFCGTKEGDCWLEGFSEPYTTSRFYCTDKTATARLPDPMEWWGGDDVRELRVTLRKHPKVA